MTEYRDAVTGYTIRRYTEGPGRNAKLYFTTENFTPDDRYFFFNRYENDAADDAGVYRADVQTGELLRIVDLAYSHFVLDRVRNVGYVNRNESEVYEVDLTDYSMKKLFDLPEGGRMTCHITAADTGRLACSYQLPSKIYALMVMDPGKEPEVIHMSDYNLGHAQICPTDENLLFFIHETGGDALQRT